MSSCSSVKMLLWRLLEVWKYVVVAYDVDVAGEVHLRVPEACLVRGGSYEHSGYFNVGVVQWNFG